VAALPNRLYSWLKGDLSMAARLLTALTCLLALATPAAAQDAAPAPVAAPDGVELLLDGLRAGLEAGDAAALLAWLGPDAAPGVRGFASGLLQPGRDVVRALVVERDRRELEGATPETGHSLTVEFYTETASRARIVTARVDVERPDGGDAASWRVVDAEQLTNFEGLYRLALNVGAPYEANGLTLTAEDLEISLPRGTVFEVDSDEGVTGLVLVGRGTMRFAPRPESERTQMRIFTGGDVLDTTFETAFIRLSPTEYDRQVSRQALQATVANPADVERARAVFADESPKSYNLDLGDLSPEAWYLLPATGDFIAEVRTRDYDTLSYARTIGQAEDVVLFDRVNSRTIALYASEEKLRERGRFYSEDDVADYDVIDLGLDANIRFVSGPRTPRFPYIEGAARLTVRVRTDLLSTLTLRLENDLNVEGIASVEHGRLLYLRLRDQNSVIVNLPTALRAGEELTLLVAYSGPVRNETLDNYAIVQGDLRANVEVLANGNIYPFYPPEPNLLLSSRSYWYPQGPVTDYATATMRITVPNGYGAVASGGLTAQTAPAAVDDETATAPARTLVFRAPRPVRYLSVIVSRLEHVADARVSLPAPQGGEAPSVVLSIDANVRQEAEGRNLVEPASDILRFFTELMGAYPYEAMSIALVESGIPGGHSPAYATMLNQPVPGTPYRWNNDPSSFSDYPEFFLAHELAHQWWGQAVGWNNYHEQWLSEGFAQYFSALYARERHGEQTFTRMLSQLNEWAMRESDEGPIYLGYRLGHIRREGRVFRALVYNKGASVLHMLRQVMGDDAFFGGLRAYYTEFAFSKAGTDDFQRVMEAAAGRPLDRFFERWIFGAGLPQVRYTTATETDATVVRLEQLTEVLYDVPVTVTASYAGGRTESVVVVLAERETEARLPPGARQVQVNADSGALGTFRQR
jgi:hypothetical protein